MEKQDCAICTEKLKLNLKTAEIDEPTLKDLVEDFGTRKSYLLEICQEAKVRYSF